MTFPARLWRGVDWWLAPRWRAMLTWAVISAAIWTGCFHEIDSTISRTVYNASKWLERGLPAVAGWNFYAIWSPIVMTCFRRGFEPLVLRVGWWRTAAWLVLAIAADLSWKAVSFWESLPPSLETFSKLALSAGLPTLAMARRRSRPWMWLFAAVAFAAAWLITDDLKPSVVFKRELRWAVAQIVFGAVLIYGTLPLPRREVGVRPCDDSAGA